MNLNARYITAEVSLNEAEKRRHVEVCRDLGIGLSTWYRGLANAAARVHGMPPAPPREPSNCRGMRPASRAAAAKGSMRRNL
jgi:hypothetical protein